MKVIKDISPRVLHTDCEVRRHYSDGTVLRNHLDITDMSVTYGGLDEVYKVEMTGVPAPIGKAFEMIEKCSLADVRKKVYAAWLVPGIKDVIYNDPATIVMWADDTKTVVKCQPGDVYDPELGLAMAIAKKALGNKGKFNDEFKKWLPHEEDDEIAYWSNAVKVWYSKLP